jgi:hypothetical protein
MVLIDLKFSEELEVQAPPVARSGGWLPGFDTVLRVRAAGHAGAPAARAMGRRAGEAVGTRNSSPRRREPLRAGRPQGTWGTPPTAFLWVFKAPSAT